MKPNQVKFSSLPPTQHHSLRLETRNPLLIIFTNHYQRSLWVASLWDGVFVCMCVLISRLRHHFASWRRLQRVKRKTNDLNLKSLKSATKKLVVKSENLHFHCHNSLNGVLILLSVDLISSSNFVSVPATEQIQGKWVRHQACKSCLVTQFVHVASSCVLF